MRTIALLLTLVALPGFPGCSGKPKSFSDITLDDIYPILTDEQYRIPEFLVDTRVGFGLETGTIGIALPIASRSAQLARVLVWTVIASELTRGIAFDA
jgi:hypothetical protein